MKKRKSLLGSENLIHLTKLLKK